MSAVGGNMLNYLQSEQERGQGVCFFHSVTLACKRAHIKRRGPEIHLNTIPVPWIRGMDSFLSMILEDYASQVYTDRTENTIHWFNVDLMLGNRRRRWIDIKLAFVQCFKCARINPGSTRRWPKVGVMMGQRRSCWTNDKPSLCQCLTCTRISGS